jgi:hypothetical protein
MVLEFLQEYTQYIGLIAAFLMIIRFQFTSAKIIKICTMLGAFFFMLHYIGLSIISVAILCVIGTIRSGVLATDWGMKHRNYVASTVILSALLAGAVFWSGFIALLPVFGIISNTFAEIQNCTKRLRLIAFITPCMWLVFDIVSGSYGGVIADSTAIISNAIGIYRHHYRKNNKV